MLALKAKEEKQSRQRFELTFGCGIIECKTIGVTRYDEAEISASCETVTFSLCTLHLARVLKALTQRERSASTVEAHTTARLPGISGIIP